MDQFLAFLRDLLKPYVVQHNLSFMITDRKGLPVDTVNGYQLAFLDYLQEILLEPYEQIIAKLTDISFTVSYDILIPGVHLLVIPVKAFNGNEYYIWTGALLEEHNPDTIFDYLSKASHNPHKWLNIFIHMPMLSLSYLELLSSRLNTVADLASQFLTTKNNETDYKDQIDMIQQITTAMNSNQSLGISNLLSTMLMYMEGIQFCGYALKIEENTYRIIEQQGTELEQMNLIGAEFSSGEGFLGQIGLYEQIRSLQAAVDDPRLNLFQQRGISPNHIYGAPVKDEMGVSGIFFVGTIDPHIHYSEHVTLTLHVITNLYSSFLVLENNKTNLRRQKAYLSALSEVSRLMNTVHDLRRLLFILIDISMNLVIGANASYLIYHEPGKSKAQIVSRGMPVDKVESYTQDVLKRKPDKGEVVVSNLPPMSIQHTSWGDRVLECTIICRGEVRGLLSISLPVHLNVEEYMIVFETYVYLATIALERLIFVKQEDQDLKIVSLLHEALGCWNQNEYENSKRMKEIAVDFAMYLQLPSEHISTIELACLISSYGMAFIGQQQLAPGLIHLSEEYHRASIGESQDGIIHSIPCQVMLLSIYKVNGVKADSAALDKGIEHSVQHKFDSFILRDQIIDYEISIDEPERSSGRLIDFDVFQKAMQISRREKDVLELIVQGLHNRDIADTLFISEHTVKNHITNLFQKLKVTDRAQAIALAYKIGFKS